MIFSYIVKLISILSKLLFIVLIIKKLPTGIFSEYFFYSTLGLGLGRVISLASDDSILSLSKGRFSIESYFNRTFPVLYFLTFISVLCLALFSFSFIGSIAFALMIMISSYVSGVYRGRKPWVYEYIANVPWILSIILTIFMDFHSSNDIFLNLGLSYLVVFLPFLIVSISKIGFYFSLRPLLFLLRRYEFWMYKLLANFQIILSMRAYPLYLTNRADLLADRFSILFSLGEVFWQLYMIVINRWYSKYSTTGISNYYKDLKCFIGIFIFINMIALSLFYLLKEISIIESIFCLVDICKINYYREIFVFLFISSFSLMVMMKNFFFIRFKEKIFFYIMILFNSIIVIGFYFLEGLYISSLLYQNVVLFIFIFFTYKVMKKI